MTPASAIRLAALLVAVVGLPACAWLGRSPNALIETPDQATVTGILADWNPKAQLAAHTMIVRYGLPQEATRSHLVWHRNGPWKRTVVANEEILHRFPSPHSDMLYQVIDYAVPPEKFDELAAFDGSLIAERTKGELAAHCDREEANFLAVNLTHDIVTGRRSVDEARLFYAETLRDQSAPRYTSGFVFQVKQTGQGDPDTEVALAENSFLALGK